MSATLTDPVVSRWVNTTPATIPWITEASFDTSQPIALGSRSRLTIEDSQCSVDGLTIIGTLSERGPRSFRQAVEIGLRRWTNTTVEVTVRPRRHRWSPTWSERHERTYYELAHRCGDRVAELVTELSRRPAGTKRSTASSCRADQPARVDEDRSSVTARPA